MPLNAIEQLLKQHMGLHSATIGSSTVCHAVEQRMRDCKMDDRQEYLRVLQHSPTEMDALIDTVVIPETWFFRDRNPFSAFSAWVKNEWLPYNSLKPLRVLSVPCSSGEEPFTVAMCLADLDLPATAAQIDAVDISHRNIGRAMRACYGNNSFRGSDLGFRERHFVAEDQRYRLTEDIRTRVSFARANILDLAFLQQRQPYHVIFCRNLLIYFDRPTQNQAIERLEQLLMPHGVLFLGHSETSLLLERSFTPLDYPCSFGFRRGRKRDEDAAAARPGSRPVGTVRTRTAHRADASAATETAKPFSTANVTATPKPTAPVPADNATLLGDAFRLANQGHLDEAAERCETLLQLGCHQADAHFLLGLIRESAGNIRDAEQMLRKAIYLDPDHYEALTHLSVLCLQNGDASGAQCFRQRATRAQQRQQARAETK
jgi:chemotaxis protein methyltransferase WspC